MSNYIFSELKILTDKLLCNVEEWCGETLESMRANFYFSSV